MGNNHISSDPSPTSMTTLKIILEGLSEAKANDICQLDVRSLTDITDFMVIASGTSHRHVHAMADQIREAALQHHLRPIGIEGDSENDWILIDFSDVVAHIMMPETRQFYSLERLWDYHLSAAVQNKSGTPSDN
jgi:ribosome-associated protein